MVILLFGPPGSGKGTQSPLITRMLNIPAISTGEMLRAEVASESELGKHAAAILADGKLVGDDLVNAMLVKRISEPDCRPGFLLDGYPRTTAQAVYLDKLVAERGFPPPVVLHLATPNHVLIERISNRRQCPECCRIYNNLFMPPIKRDICDVDGTRLVRRKDDTTEVIEKRLAEYEAWTRPVLEHYKDGDYHFLNANRPSAEVFRDIKAIFAQCAARADARRRAALTS